MWSLVSSFCFSPRGFFQHHCGCASVVRQSALSTGSAVTPPPPPPQVLSRKYSTHRRDDAGYFTPPRRFGGRLLSRHRHLLCRFPPTCRRSWSQNMRLQPDPVLACFPSAARTSAGLRSCMTSTARSSGSDRPTSATPRRRHGRTSTGPRSPKKRRSFLSSLSMVCLAQSELVDMIHICIHWPIG